MQTILTGFLAANLLPIGDDDEKLNLLDEAAADLAKRLESAPILAYRFALVGFDERALVTDPVCKLVADAVTARWQTIANKIGAGPVQVYRAVMLRALELVAAKRPEFRQAILLLARNQPPGAMEGKATEAVRAMLAGFDGSVSDEMNRTWVNAVDMSLPKLSAKLKKPAGIKEDLSLGLSRAVGPNDKEGRQVTNPNPHWPTTGQTWAQEFAPRATEAIHTAVQNAAKGFAEDMQEALKETVVGWSDALNRLAVRDAKAELLWIRTSLYSPAAGAGYRDLQPPELALYAVLDISRAVAANAPPSVEYFLRELVTSQKPDRVRLADLLAVIGPKLATLSEGKAIAAAEQLPVEGRRSWLDFAVRPAAAGASFEEQTGVPGAFEDGLAEIAVKLYRELQVRKLLTAGS
jgi:hypothetical protein